MSDEEEAEIEKIIREHSHEFIDYQKLKTRKSGNVKHIDFHITVVSDRTVEEIHDIIGNLKKDMNQKLKNTRINIHIDPYKKREN